MNSKRQPNHFASESGDKRKNYNPKKCTKCGQMWHENNQICPAKGIQFKFESYFCKNDNDLITSFITITYPMRTYEGILLLFRSLSLKN
jgi:uncharacterized OB-fold protein